MEERKIVCDGCGRDLTYTGNCEGWRLVVAAQAIGQDPAHRGMPVTAMHVPNPQPDPLHFCHWGCLHKLSGR